MIKRTFDANLVAKAIKLFLETEDIVDPIEWISKSENIVLVNDDGDMAIFEYSFPIHKVYAGHYYFQSRGRNAIKAARGFLDELFNTCYNINVVMGLVPEDRKDAKWMTRKIGFTSYGTEEIDDKQYELFILTKKEFNGE